MWLVPIQSVRIRVRLRISTDKTMDEPTNLILGTKARGCPYISAVNEIAWNWMNCSFRFRSHLFGVSFQNQRFSTKFCFWFGKHNFPLQNDNQVLKTKRKKKDIWSIIQSNGKSEENERKCHECKQHRILLSMNHTHWGALNAMLNFKARLILHINKTVLLILAFLILFTWCTLDRKVTPFTPYICTAYGVCQGLF